MNVEKSGSGQFAEFKPAASKAAELEAKVAVGLFEDGKSFAMKGVRGLGRWVGVFQFPEQGSVLIALHDDRGLASTTLALASEVNLIAGERGTIVRYVEIDSDGSYKDVDVEKSKKPLHEWLTRQVNTHGKNPFRDIDPPRPNLRDVNRSLEQDTPEEDEPLDPRIKEALFHFDDDKDDEIDSEDLLEFRARMMGKTSIDIRPSTSFLENLRSVVDIIDPERHNITQRYFIPD